MPAVLSNRLVPGTAPGAVVPLPASFASSFTCEAGTATVHFTIPMPEDSLIGGADISEIALGRRVMKSASCGSRVSRVLRC